MFTLTIKAEQTGVTNLRPDDTQDNPFWYMFKVQSSIKAAPLAYEQSEPPKAHKIIEFDCRGLEFTEFKPEGEWLAEGIDSGTKFTAIDLADGEWFDYDEKAGEEVSIKDIVWEIRRA
ncbi:hypothetical protein MHUMG1_00906 [Metarhizium humberi]|uniref:Uncharacterized protein n=1 Tax=Metarhizium humberi TaxID=2596975 RepID=A0A9P8SCB2_9HYPO|nr:UPF0587 protein C2D10.03c [Metarhizium anisopliae]KAH0602027.1 hypothetical protein MHUMG1_00906 [Metarhizium humberi]